MGSTALGFGSMRSNTIACLGLAAGLIGILAVSVTPAQAQTSFDSGSLLRQIERSLPVPSLPSVGPGEEAPKVALLQGKGERMLVRKFIISGNQLVSTAELQKAVASYEGRTLTLADLQNAAASIALIYRKQGLMAGTTIPKQEVKGGVIHLQVIEARFGGAVIDAKSNGRVHPGLVTSRFEHALPKGEPVNMFDLDRALLLSNDLAGASVSGGLTSGDRDGESRMLLLSQNQPLLNANASVDNFGARAAGSVRFTADAAVNGGLGYGEQFTVLGLHSSGSDYARLGASIPVHPSGTKLSLSGSYMGYDVVTPSLKSQNIHGDTFTTGVELSQPILRNRSFNLFAIVGYDGRMFDNKAGANTTSNYRSDAGNVGLSANLYDDFMGGGKTIATITGTYGNLNLDGSPNKTSDRLGANTQGDYAKLAMSLARLQTITKELSLLTSVNAQLANKNLSPYEKMILGGSSSLRAYAAGEGAGDEGLMGTLELQYQWPYDLQTIAFVDAGQIEQNADNRFTGAAKNNNVFYSGYGLGVSWRGPQNSTFRFTWSHRIGNNPLPLTTGKDQDGTKHLNRIWLSSAISF
jgi:hemolysin activation/secretion protein